MKRPFEVSRQYFVPQHGLSCLAGYLASSQISWLKNFLIKYFINHYAVNMAEAIESDPFAYKSFNDFFTRTLKKNARTIESDPLTIVSPADGTLYQQGKIENSTLLKAKNQTYNVNSLLGYKDEHSQNFENGYYHCIYLAPHNYHRVHMPADGKLLKMRYVPGRLFSVNKTTAEHVDQLFARNERLVCFFEGPMGKFVVVLVGAMIVSGISTPWAGKVAPMNQRKITEVDYTNNPIFLKKGEEMGCFSLGSTAITLFDREVMPDERLEADKEVWMGESLGRY
tara:strand:- start:16645 stop:17490 length:846 start_codon:yes stop_codon:yes gene_type:complete